MNDIFKKLKLRGAGIALNAPEPMKAELIKLGLATSLSKTKLNTDTLVFIRSKDDFTSFLDKDLRKIEPDSVLWFAYPKGSSKVKTDINRDVIRVTGELYGITTVTAVSIDDTWSALRFRPIEKVGK